MAADGIFFKAKGQERIRIRPGDRIRLLSDSNDANVEHWKDGRKVVGPNLFLSKGMTGVVVDCVRGSQKDPRRINVEFPGVGLQTIHEEAVEFEVLPPSNPSFDKIVN